MVLRPDSVTVIIPTIGAHELIKDARAGVPDGVQVVIADDPVPFGTNCNNGATDALGNILIFLNDDTVPQCGWLDPILDAFGDERVGIVGCRLTYPDGRIQHAGVHLKTESGILTAYNTR